MHMILFLSFFSNNIKLLIPIKISSLIVLYLLLGNKAFINEEYTFFFNNKKFLGYEFSSLLIGLKFSFKLFSSCSSIYMNE